MEIIERGILPDPENPTYDVEAVKKIALSLGLPLLILWAAVVPFCLLLCLKCGKSGRWDRQYIRKAPVIIIIGVLWLIVEFCQINWFTFAMKIPWKGRNFLVFLDFFQLNFRISWEAWYWIFVGYALLVITVILLLLCCCEGGEEASMGSAILFLSMIPIFQPMMHKMMEALSCTYPIGEDPYMDTKPSVVCWKGLHILYVTFSVLLILVFYPSISITMSMIIGGRRDGHVVLAFAVIQFKLLQVFVFVFFNSYTLATLLGLGGINIFYLAVSFSMPTNNRLIGLWRSVSMFLCVWGVVSTLVAYGVDDEDNWAPVIILIIGWIFLPIIFFLLRRLLLRKKEDTPSHTVVPPPVVEPPPPAPTETRPLPDVINIHLTQVQGPLDPDGKPQIQTHTVQVPLNTAANLNMQQYQQGPNRDSTIAANQQLQPQQQQLPTVNAQPAYPVGPPS